MDVMMMSLMNGKERELEEWKALFEQADPRYKWAGAIRPALNIRTNVGRSRDGFWI
jgi:hypothetical protein